MYILHSANGFYDEYESIILGVFSTLDKAEERKLDLIELANNYYKNLNQNSDEIKKLLDVWQRSWPNSDEVKYKLRSYNTTGKLEQYFELINLVENFINNDIHHHNSEYRRHKFFTELNRMRSELSDLISIDSLPEFPSFVCEKELYDERLMRITYIAKVE